jgi:hypothetical protein
MSGTADNHMLAAKHIETARRYLQPYSGTVTAGDTRMARSHAAIAQALCACDYNVKEEKK